jgi:hypothetical protein
LAVKGAGVVAVSGENFSEERFGVGAAAGEEVGPGEVGFLLVGHDKGMIAGVSKGVKREGDFAEWNRRS